MFVAHVLSSVREKVPDVTILHYMDDVLISTQTDSYLDIVLQKSIDTIQKAGFDIATEKIQCTCPCTYLGLQIGKRTIVPLQFTIKDNSRTL